MKRRLTSGAIGGAMLLICLAFDANQPLSVAVGTSYVAAVAVGLLARSKRLLVAMGSAAVLLIVLGMIISPHGDDTRIAFVNRSLAVLVTLAVTALGYELLASRERFGARLLELAQTDELTGARTRGALLDEIERRVAEHARYGSELSLLMIDVDRLKQINDRYGHLMGDRVLRRLGTTCRQVARETDVVGRYGGDEFVVVCPSTGWRAALALGARMRKAVAGARIVGLPRRERVTMSLGIAALGTGVTTATALIAAADRALYAAKRAGGDRTGVPGEARDADTRGAAATASRAGRAPRSRARRSGSGCARPAAVRRCSPRRRASCPRRVVRSRACPRSIPRRAFRS